MRAQWALWLGLLLVGAGCSTSRVVRLDTGSGTSLVHKPFTEDDSGPSTVRGGPWTPRFRKIFRKAGMELKDSENIVPLEGHKGPHPQAYHERVFDQLNGATANCRKVEECREALTRALQKLAKEVSTRGTDLNKLVTQGR